MPSVGKAFETSYMNMLSLKGENGSQLYGYFVHQTSSMVRKPNYFTPTSVISQIQNDLWIHIV